MELGDNAGTVRVGRVCPVHRISQNVSSGGKWQAVYHVASCPTDRLVRRTLTGSVGQIIGGFNMKAYSIRDKLAGTGGVQ